ncbi:glucose 1-dehydrogenase [Massilia terrae]|uniref:Glucose 1-dehydrogenase n=1 Tax=Massilia terrae TaxID=1811224 RepID=A0ABT2CWB6_9BURK|nr:glucose 1-dehydrogenase [Massilia terrae]MCS0658256.1 glucose 1-dehydrogenase [Massilia terrae]
MFALNEKTALITGAGSGIGRAMAILFAQQGAFVHVLDVSESAAAGVVEDIRAGGGHARAHACNVADYDEVMATFDRIGAIDILVNNAGIAHIGKADTTSEADFDRVMSVNVKGVYHCLHAAIPQLRKNGGGVIINMASVAAWVGIADRFAYSTAKGAVMAMTLSVAKDYIKDGIRCNSISPGRVHTPFVDGFLAKNYPGQESEMFEKLAKTQPIGRMAKPEEVAALALYLCSEQASFITGTDFPIDGGFITLNS